MRYTLITTLIIACLAGRLVAQEQEQPQQEKEYNVMIIPFDPDMYFSDSDQMLAKYNQKTIPEVRHMFRYGLSMHLSAKMVGEHGSRSMLNDTTSDVEDDLYMIYKNISYYEAKSVGPLTFQPDEKPQQKLGIGGRLFNRNENDKGQGNADNAETTSKHESRNYIATKVNDVAMLQYLHEKYGTEVFIFISQFNLVTDYEHCLDRENNVFERDLRVHYTVYDYNGNVVAGDVASIHFADNTNNLDTIIEKNFSGLSDMIMASLPKNRTITGGGEVEENDMNNSIRNN